MKRMLILCLILLATATALSATEGRRLYNARLGWIRLTASDAGYELFVRNSSAGEDLRWNLGPDPKEASSVLSEFLLQAGKLKPGQFFFASVDGRQVQCHLRKIFGQYSFMISSKWFEGVAELPLSDVEKICQRLCREG